MRDIRFRAWDKEHHLMNYFGANIYLCLDGKIVSIDNNGDEEGIYTLELMQFTGLLDNQGKEIYEGDIAKIDDRDIYEVCWDLISGCWCLRRSRKLEPDFPARKDGKVYYGYGYYKSKENLEVIGNIYENPELLKKE